MSSRWTSLPRACRFGGAGFLALAAATASAIADEAPAMEAHGAEAHGAEARAAAVSAIAAGRAASVTGVADLRLTTSGSRLTLRLLFAASGEPARLRIEVVRGGMLQAIAWYDAERLLVFAPTQGLLHEGPPTRATLEAALGLPFCPADVLFALRGGEPPEPPPCDAPGSQREAIGSGEEAGLELRGSGERASSLRFGRYREVAGRRWPHRIVLASEASRAVVDIVHVGRGPLAPMPPDERQLAKAKRVDAATLAERLGIERAAAEAPPPAAPELRR